MIKLEYVFNQLEGKVKDDILAELKVVVKSLCGIIVSLDYAYITDCRYRYSQNKNCIELILDYKPDTDIDKLLSASRVVYGFLRKQNPDVVRYINIIGRLPKEMMKDEKNYNWF